RPSRPRWSIPHTLRCRSAAADPRLVTGRSRPAAGHRCLGLRWCAPSTTTPPPASPMSSPSATDLSVRAPARACRQGEATAPAVLADELSRSYGPVRALQCPSLSAERGAVTALLGNNGAGKTTAISCATGLLRPDGGTVRVLGSDPWRSGPEHRARVGVMIQDGGLTSGASAMQLRRYGASLHASPLAVDEVAEHLGIDSFARTLVRRLSGGQRQRLALALAIIGRPDLVFL